ncbi:predicted protein [Histoplasma mississippiense (nom. inval.)]|uniref:predicted protein n=1 Tax=Ajellomyces capsulatus (strain NAm1 / WU24) TaxID=2059318 RepID=UPI000157B934|nr:predicted protein [Histoplasma mississippiense (nom. inval.)]EDN03777.1 predicted protein [Histoplasma mississippiense (nom. inval.)]
MASEADVLDLSVEKDRCWLGSAKVDLAHLKFGGEQAGVVARHVSQSNVKWLMDKFETDRCRRLEPQHWIPVAIDQAGFEQILSYNSMTNLTAAAEWLDPNDQWWVVKFYEINGLSPEAFRSLQEYRDASQELSSGEICWNVMYHQQQGDETKVGEWLARWAGHPTYYRNFNQLQKGSRKAYLIRDALSKLHQFPGLWRSWNMGSLNLLLPMRCPEELSNGLSHIWNVWNRIMGDRPDLLDADSVDSLEGRCPYLSKDDREYIDELFGDGAVFPHFDKAEERELLHRRLMETQTIIPSFRTFIKDAKQLDPIVKLLRRFQPPKYKGTVQEGMKRCYKQPAHDFYVQISEVAHRRERNVECYGFWSAYRQMVLAAMRHFVGLVPGSLPLKMHKVPPSQLQGNPLVLWNQFKNLSSSVGFILRSGPFVRDNGCPPQDGNNDALDTDASHPRLTCNGLRKWSIGSHCGMTDGPSYYSDRKYLYLDNIYSHPGDVPRSQMTSFAVKRNFMLVYFPQFEPRDACPNVEQHRTIVDTDMHNTASEVGHKYGVIFDTETSEITCVLDVDSLLNPPWLKSDIWCAPPLHEGHLTIVPPTVVPSDLRRAKLIFIGSTSRQGFQQKLLFPDYISTRIQEATMFPDLKMGTRQWVLISYGELVQL